MIRITCDNCEKPFEADESDAGGRLACPYCGDVNRVPGTEATATVPAAVPRGREVASSPRSASAAAVSPGEESRLRIVRAAMFRAHPLLYSLMVLLFLAGLVLAVGAAISVEWKDTLIWIGVAMSIVAAIWWLIWWLAPHRWVRLEITSKRTIRHEGIIMRKTSEVLHNHIRNIKIEQTFFQRLLGVGSLSIDAAGGDSETPIEIEVRDIPDPDGVRQLIDKHRRI
jgi:membrane protein YdbS with pleckstrin-like domain